MRSPEATSQEDGNMTENTFVNAEQIPRVRRPMVPAAQAQALIVAETIELLRKLPFDQVTAQLISKNVKLTMPTIWRNFGSMEGLFSYVSSVLMTNAVERWRAQGSQPVITIFFDPDVALRARLIAWLLAEGADPQLFRSPLLGSLIEDFQRLMPEANSRVSTSWIYITTMLLQSYAVFGQINQITDEITADNFALMTYFRDLLPTAAQNLGWND